LLRRGHDVHATVRDGADRRRIADLDALRLHPGGIDTIPVRPDVAISLAWIATPGKYLAAPENRDCLEATRRLLASLECRAVVAGTCFEFDTSLGRLREESIWPEVDAIAITHWHLDHWGDLVPWVWGTFYLASNGPVKKPALWVQPEGAQFLCGLGERLGFPDMFERTFDLAEYEPDKPFSIGKLAVTPTRVPHYRLETYAFRVQSNGAVLTYSGDSAPSDELVEAAREAGALGYVIKSMMVSVLPTAVREAASARPFVCRRQ
jgi:ribonuclease BN (tRNA processing enzyme)